MIIIAGNSSVELAKKVAAKLEIPIALANTKRFRDQELRVQINENMNGQDVVIMQSTSRPVNDNVMELLLLADTAKCAGAKHLTAVIPYFGYARQDRHSYLYGPISSRLSANLLEAAGIGRIITVELHSGQLEGFFGIGVRNLSSLPLFASLFQGDHRVENCVVVSPDIGGIARARSLARKLKTAIAVVNKARKEDGECISDEVIGYVEGKNCILVDDIVDSGGTLCKAAELLRKNGAITVSACATHAVFSEGCMQKIMETKFSHFYTTDTISHQNLPEQIQVISVDQLIADALRGHCSDVHMFNG
jgi:ribose-phosphate pyrophosphokinase